MAMTLLWTLGDRLAKARRQADISVEAMAANLGVSVKTVNNIEHDRVPVKRAYVLGYHLATRIPLDELDPEGFGPDTGGDLASSRSRCTAQTSGELATVTALRWTQPTFDEVAA